MSLNSIPLTLTDIPVGKTVTVKVPASSANLGPGYDTLGLALGYYDELTVERIAEGLEFELSGEGSDTVPRNENHLVVRSMRTVFEKVGLDELPALRLTAHNRIPHSRGMGSSASAIVAGVAAASALLPEYARLSRDQIFQIASDVEGHPDNVAPSVYGSLSISWGELGDWHSLIVPVHPTIVPVVAVPDYEVSTKLARSLIPAEIPHGQAAANLMDATVDYLHQGYRVPAMQPSAALVAYLREQQLPAVISGAGPTVLTFAHGAKEASRVCEFVEKFMAEHPGNIFENRHLSWRVMPLEIDGEGVIVTQ